MARSIVWQASLLQDEGQSLMRAAITQMNLSAHAHHRTRNRTDQIGESYPFRQGLTNQEKNIANSMPSNEPEATSPG